MKAGSDLRVRLSPFCPSRLPALVRHPEFAVATSARRPGFQPLAFLCFLATIAALYFGQDFFLPLALAILISFLLAPLIDALERLRLGRIFSVICAALLTFGALGFLAYLLAGQVLDLATELPKYKANLKAKIEWMHPAGGGTLDKAKDTIKELSEEIKKEPEEKSEATSTSVPAPAPKPKKADPVPVEMVPSDEGTLGLAQRFLERLLRPLGTAAVVIVFVIFMSIEREDLRDRFVHLIGRGHLRTTTQAIDEAANRVSRYLGAQLLVNLTYGVPIGLGLWVLGIPNAFLWGVMATVLRFVPYLGPWIAASFPVALSLALEAGWTLPLMTVGLFVVVELISNNVVEPWLYGSSTGLSPVAIIVSAMFWTWLWGGIGLVMATPLTVCLCVLGKYIPNLSFFDVLLGANPPIAPADLMYQRLLGKDDVEVTEFAEEFIAAHSFAELCDVVLLPAIHQVEKDYRADILPDDSRNEIYRLLKRIIAELTEAIEPSAGSTPVLIIPANHIGDETAGLMLAAELWRRGVRTETLSSRLLAGELVEKAVEKHPPLVVISALPPTSILAAGSLIKRIKARLPDLGVMVAVWSSLDLESDKKQERLRRAGAREIHTSVQKAAEEIAKLDAYLPRPEIEKNLELKTQEV